MRFINFNLLRNFKYKQICPNLAKHLTTDVFRTDFTIDQNFRSDPRFIEVLTTWNENEEIELRDQVLKHMQVFPEFINEEEEVSLYLELEPQLKRVRYEYNHREKAIEDYRESERSSWNENNSKVISRVRSMFAPGAQLLPSARVLDLAPGGHIRPHVDAVRFCGETIAGLSLLSTGVMRLQHQQRPDLALDVLLQRRGLYVMSGVVRYKFTHAILGDDESMWKGARLPLRRRIAIIHRERPKPEDTT